MFVLPPAPIVIVAAPVPRGELGACAELVEEAANLDSLENNKRTKTYENLRAACPETLKKVSSATIAPPILRPGRCNEIV